MQRQRIGENLRHARQELRLSQRTVADEVGVSRQAVSAAESGKRAITVEELLKLANLYRRRPDFFLSSTDSAAANAISPRIQRRENARAKNDLDAHDEAEIQSFTTWLQREPSSSDLNTPAGPKIEIVRESLAAYRKL